MIPVLFKKNEQQFRSYGLGPIHDIISPKVTRERNGQYLLYFQYPQDAEFADVFEEDMRIKSDAGVRTKWQTFEITRVVRKEGKLIEVFAKHISQSLLKDALNPSVSVRSLSAEQALRIWNNNRIGDEEFDVWSDISTTSSTNWDIRDVSNAFEALAGVQGSILDVWGGEYEFDNKLIRLHKEMGRKSPVPLEYGRNITGLEQDQQEDNVYTSVYPFATYTAEGDNQPKTVTLPERYIDGKYLEFHNKRKIQVVDFSGEFESDDIPTVSRLRTLTENYLNANEVGLPHENLKVEYIDLSKTLDYQEFQTMEEVELNDRLPIFYPKFGITNENAKVVVINYDPVKEENISIELGVIGQSFRTVTTGGLGSRLDRVEKQQDATNNYIVNAKGNRIWFETPNEDMEHKIGDTWFEKNGPHDRIRVWNGNQWETIIDSEDIDKNAKAIAAQQQAIEEAKRVADDAVNRIDNDIANKFTSIDEEILAIESISNSAQANAQTALTQSIDALGDASLALTNAQTAINTAGSAISSANEIRSLANDLSIQVSDWEITVDGFTQTINDMEGTVSSFRNDVNGFQSTVAAYETELDEYGNEVRRYATEVSTFSNTVDGFNSTVSSYGQEVQNLAGEVVGYKNQVSTFNNTVNGFNSTVAQYQVEVDEFGNEVNSYATQVSEFENTVNGFRSQVSSVERDYQGISGTVATHTSQISNLDGVIALKANTTTVNTLTGRVTTAESGITANANAIKLKASQSSVDTLAGTVNTLGTELDIAAGQISSKVWNTDIKTAVDGIEVGGRNLIANSDTFNRGVYAYGIFPTLTSDGYLEIETTESNGNWHTVWWNSNLNFSHTEDSFKEGDDFTVSFIIKKTEDSTGMPNIYIKSGMGYFKLTGYIGTEFSKISYTGKWKKARPIDPHLGWNRTTGTFTIKAWKIEKGNKATDWTPAPEDTTALINHVESELTQKYDSITASVSSIDGRVAAQKLTLDSISSTVSGHGGRISTVEQTASGLQTTVASKASQTQVTQLSNLVDTKVTASQVNESILADKRYKDTRNDNQIPSWYYSNYTKETVMEFKGLSTMGISGEGTYGVLETVVPWSNSSGGGIKQTLRTDYGVWEREQNGSSVWKAWRKTADRTWVGAQISVLEDNINLRVAKGDLLSQINIEAGRTLIQSDKLLLNATNTVITGTAWMDGAVIANASIDTAQIADLAVTSAKIANLDVNKLSGNKGTWIINEFRSASGGNVEITGDGLRSTHTNGSSMTYSSAELKWIDPQGDRGALSPWVLENNVSDRSRVNHIGLSLYPQNFTDDVSLRLYSKGTNTLSFGNDDINSGYEFMITVPHNDGPMFRSKYSRYFDFVPSNFVSGWGMRLYSDLEYGFRLSHYHKGLNSYGNTIHSITDEGRFIFTRNQHSSSARANLEAGLIRGTGYHYVEGGVVYNIPATIGAIIRWIGSEVRWVTV